MKGYCHYPPCTYYGITVEGEKINGKWYCTCCGCRLWETPVRD